VHALRIAARTLVTRLGGGTEPVLVISHAPPAGAGDAVSDAYHVGFPAYRWLMDRLHPPLWLHGHTTTASVAALDAVVGPTTLVNVTGAVLVELVPPDDGTA
jgi:Icc-related predicted phosphoesterase